MLEVKNTPDHVRRARYKEYARKEEVTPRLVLAPFSKPPQVVFENVIGPTCERKLEIFNPSKQVQQITLSHTLPPGLKINLPEGGVVLDPETVVSITISWTPTQPTAVRESIHFTTENHGQYDVNVVLKYSGNVKGKKEPKAFNTCPLNVQSIQHDVLAPSNISNMDFSMDNVQPECPFDSPTSSDLNSDIFPIKVPNTSNHHTNRPSYEAIDQFPMTATAVQKPSNDSASDIFDELTFTPHTHLNEKTDKLDKGPKIVMYSDSEDSLDEIVSNKGNEILSNVTSQQNNDSRINYQNCTQLDIQVVEATRLQTRYPYTSTPGEQGCDMSFVSQRFSTDRIMQTNYEATDSFDDWGLNSDTYTIYIPSISINILRKNSSTYLVTEQSKFFRQTPSKESQQYRETDERFYMPLVENNVYPYNQRPDIKSPPIPCSQSIPEDIQILCGTGKQTTTSTINRIFAKPPDNSISSSQRHVWSNKDLADNNNDINQNNAHNHIGNDYSQSTTVDPFSSSSYFYDEEAVQEFKKGSMRWLNYILLPHADLDSKVEQKYGKAWLENRNKEIPAAPTKEQVSSAHYSSNILASFRRKAKALLMSPEIALVTQKLNVQIEKKMISMKTDKHLHLDVGLQNAIMELLLCYNPLWLRIGLEAIYDTVLPLKSNSDIKGLTTFIFQRMFQNPHLKNNHPKSSAPYMLLPADIEANQKFTLKKFFLLVFFLDQAKEKKLIPHDPCLFCRNAVCKESREIIIRFTREVIASIGDITKRLRPLGYVVSHKQSYLDEYEYAVHNIDLDFMDGVRLTKVMEIILMRNDLLNQLRTPPISRLTKIHNVQVALNALKEAKFVIAGDINARDIANGHREKTLSLLWQLMHVFRAPLFEKAANVIQTWWRKKYKEIVEKREDHYTKKHKAAAVTIQRYYRGHLETKKQRKEYLEIVSAAKKIQISYRLYRTCKLIRKKFCDLKNSAIKVQRWYRSIRVVRTRRSQYLALRQAVVTVQQRFRALRAMREQRQHYLEIRCAAIKIQTTLRAQRLMQEERSKYRNILTAVLIIQRAYRAYSKGKQQRTRFLKIKSAAVSIQVWVRSIEETRKIRNEYQQLRKAALFTQRRFRAIKERDRCRTEYLSLKKSVLLIQATYRMMIQRRKFLVMKTAAITIQTRYRSYRLCKWETRREAAAICIQKYFRRYRAQRQYKQYIAKVVYIQKMWRGKLVARRHQCEFMQKKATVIRLQAAIRGYLVRRNLRRKKEDIEKLEKEQRLHRAACIIQAYYRGYLVRRNLRRKKEDIEKLEEEQRLHRAACTIQAYYRGYLVRRNLRRKKEDIEKLEEEQRLHRAACTIQAYYRGYKIRSQEENKQVAHLRRRWREGALKSTQASMKERHEELLEILRHQAYIQTARAFRTLELLTELFPRKYEESAPSVVRYLYVYMATTNRSITSIEILKSAASVLVNLTRHTVTGPKIYSRENILPILKFMVRFRTNGDLVKMFATFIWLFAKYDGIREDLTEYLRAPENYKMISTIKGSVERLTKMDTKLRHKTSHNPQVSKVVSHARKRDMNMCSNMGSSHNKGESLVWPALEPDYGITRSDKPKYFLDPYQGIKGIINTFKIEL